MENSLMVVLCVRSFLKLQCRDGKLSQLLEVAGGGARLEEGGRRQVQEAAAPGRRARQQETQTMIWNRVSARKLTQFLARKLE